MKVNAYRVLNHPSGEIMVFSKTRASYYVAAGYGVEQTTEKMRPTKNER
ncbi:hypothetical protein [Halorubrum spindle-shaped virus-BLv25]|nr:hypothetical protein [Halorubrum spindle-shaped virus-BLv25]